MLESVTAAQQEWVRSFTDELAGIDQYTSSVIRREPFGDVTRQYLGLDNPSRHAVFATIAFAQIDDSIFAFPRMNTPPPGLNIVRHLDVYDQCKEELDPSRSLEWRKYWSIILWRDDTVKPNYPAHFQDWTDSYSDPVLRCRIYNAASELTSLVLGLLLFRNVNHENTNGFQLISEGTTRTIPELEAN